MWTVSKRPPHPPTRGCREGWACGWRHRPQSLSAARAVRTSDQNSTYIWTFSSEAQNAIPFRLDSFYHPYWELWEGLWLQALILD